MARTARYFILVYRRPRISIPIIMFAIRDPALNIMCNGIGMSKLSAQLFTTLTPKYIMTIWNIIISNNVSTKMCSMYYGWEIFCKYLNPKLTVEYARSGTFGVFLPKSDVNMNPSTDINKNEVNVTKFPHPVSALTNNSRNITFKLHPTNTVNIANFTRRLVPSWCCVAEDSIITSRCLINFLFRE